LEPPTRDSWKVLDFEAESSLESNRFLPLFASLKEPPALPVGSQLDLATLGIPVEGIPAEVCTAEGFTAEGSKIGFFGSFADISSPLSLGKAAREASLPTLAF
jgi:hypothetical protein